MVGSLASLAWLTLGAFAIGTEGFMIAGLLPALAHDLDVGLPAAGHLVTVFALAYALGAPVLAVLTAGLERKRLLAIAMGGFALANLLAALAPGYVGLMGARLLLALSAATFMPAASGYAAGLGGPERRGRALSMVIGGLTVAIIAGVPLGDALGWRATFLAVAGLGGYLPAQRPCLAAATAAQGHRHPGRAPGAGPAARRPVGPGDHRADRSQHLRRLYLSRRLPPSGHRLWPARPGGGAAGLLRAPSGPASPASRRTIGARAVPSSAAVVSYCWPAWRSAWALPQAATAVFLPILLSGFASWGVTTAQ